jgi:hypothetical protein
MIHRRANGKEISDYRMSIFDAVALVLTFFFQFKK